MSPNSTVLKTSTPLVDLPASPSLDLVVSHLSDDNLVTLKQTIAVIKAAQTDTKNPDQKIADRAKLKLGSALYYLTGFMDGIGAFQPHLKPGFEASFASKLKLPQEDPQTQLDTFLKQMDDAFSKPDTRLAVATIALGLFLAGAICKIAAACMD